MIDKADGGTQRGEVMALVARYQRLEKIVDAAVADEVSLLRVARSLRAMHGDLARALQTCNRGGDAAREAGKAEASLAGLEADVLHVLLDHHAMVRREVFAALEHALRQAWAVIRVLQIEDR